MYNGGMRRRSLASLLKELDDSAKTLDKTLKTVTGRGLESWTRQAWQELLRTRVKVARPAADDPYAVLDLEPSCIPSEVVSRYRELAKKYHPDGTHPDVEKSKRITRAYEQIPREWQGAS